MIIMPNKLVFIKELLKKVALALFVGSMAFLASVGAISLIWLNGL